MQAITNGFGLYNTSSNICLVFIEVKTEEGLVDSPCMSFDGQSPSAYKKSQGYDDQTPLAMVAVLDYIKGTCERKGADLNRAVILGLGPTGCLAMSMALSAHSNTEFAACAIIDSFLPRNYALYSLLKQSALKKPLFMCNR